MSNETAAPGIIHCSLLNYRLRQLHLGLHLLDVLNGIDRVQLPELRGLLGTFGTVGRGGQGRQRGGPHGMPSVSRFSILFLLEAGGGLALGLVAGYAVSRMVRLSDDYALRTLLTLALAMGGYALADALHLSAPLEAVAAGLMVNYRARAVSLPARQRTADFWALLDDMLNVVLFLLLGFAMILVPISTRLFVAGLLTIPAVLLARAALVAVVLFPLRRYVDRFGALCAVLTWGGLRGALSVALVLALANHNNATQLLSITYTVVVFSVLAQGLTMVPLLRRLGYARS